VSVGDPGNACDSQLNGCFGAVDSNYRISKFEVTKAQYTEFLNAVAATDTYGLYNAFMGTALGGISVSGSPGSLSYTASAARANMPVMYVSFYDSLRFANWLHNGQPMGAQGSATTEDGAYTITAMGIANNSITRNSGASVFLPSEDEWYKAAYYDALSTSFFDFPAGTDVVTGCMAPSATANTANCRYQVRDTTDVGSYTGSGSPTGTFDQGGNVEEWNEAVVDPGTRGSRGGAYFGFTALPLGAAARSDWDPSTESNQIGFRVASVPEPGTGLLLMTGLALGLVFPRRRHG
jgi:formylglycine-generating enzyme required for sulfatase activity